MSTAINTTVARNPTSPRVSVVTLNWNGWRDTVECLDSLLSMEYIPFDIVVLDNASTDGSVGNLESWAINRFASNPSEEVMTLHGGVFHLSAYPILRSLNGSKPACSLIIVKGSTNLGFAEGNNLAIGISVARYHPAYVLLLNNDTVVSRNLLRSMIDAAVMNPSTGLVGPKVLHHRVPNRLGCAGGTVGRWTARITHKYAGQIDIGQFSHIEQRDFVSGTCMLFSVEALSRCGMLYPAFFFGGGEDVDISLRLASHGFKIISTPYALVWHKGEARQAIDLEGGRLFSYAYYAVRNTLILIFLRYRRWQLFTALTTLPAAFVGPAVGLLTSRNRLGRVLREATE